MYSIKVRNVADALSEGLGLLRAAGVPETSRNGPVLVVPHPVATTYSHPTERVLNHPIRDANPVFHLMEALWMLAGGRHVGAIAQFSSNISSYAEDDGTMHGAYGYRWRHHFDQDQIMNVVDELKRNPTSRRCVIAMWDPRVDLGANKRDLPCNTHIYFCIRNGGLEMTVCCRSNDAIWGAYGANAVHFSMLQELMAGAMGVPCGAYTQFSNNFHIYPENTVGKRFDSLCLEDSNPYLVTPGYRVKPMLAKGETIRDFLDDCQMLFLWGTSHFNTKFFDRVAGPLHREYLRRKYGATVNWDSIEECDWKIAFKDWVARRDAAKAKGVENA